MRHGRSGVSEWPLGGAARAFVALILSAVVGMVLVPATASAEPFCTDTWVGPAEGTWQTAEDWSTASVPTSSSVACIGSGKTVSASEGYAYTGVVEGAGALVIDGGQLEVSNALEASSIHALTMSAGGIRGAAAITVTGTFSGGPAAYLDGSGSLSIASGATGSVTGTQLEFREYRLINAGTLTVGKSAGLFLRATTLENSGTLIVNSEGSEENRYLYGSEATVKNTGTLEKTEGGGTSEVAVALSNEGTVRSTSGRLQFLGGGTAGEHATSNWDTSGSGSEIALSRVTYNLGAKATVGGTLEITGETVTVGQVEAPSGTVLLVHGRLNVTGSTASKIATLEMSGPEPSPYLFGSARVEITTRFTSGGAAGMYGIGTTVFLPGAVATFQNEHHYSSGEYFQLETRTLRNEGTMTIGLEMGIQMSHHALLTNAGTLIVNGEESASNHGIVGEWREATIVNEAIFEKNEGGGATTIGPLYYNYGPVIEKTGTFEFLHAVGYPHDGRACGNDPSRESYDEVDEIEGFVCPGGNLSESQTDFAIGGRGVGLELTRTYNSQAADEGIKGSFGYGWASAFSGHIERFGSSATLVEATGATVEFEAGAGETFTAPETTQDTLTGSESSGYTLTLENQTIEKFQGSSGRLESVTDRNGNETTLTYNSKGQLEKVTDPAGRTISFAYNSEGLVESATDPMKYVVKYTYEGKDLASVTQPGESALRWQFKYNGNNEMTEMLDGRKGSTTYEYNGSHQLVSKTDPMKRQTTYEYWPLSTKTTSHATGAVTEDWVSSDGEPVAITKGYGTALATTEYFRYNAAGDLLSQTNGDGHKTTYTYELGNRMRMVDPEKHETKWTYNATHDVETETRPDGEITTYKRNSHGDVLAEERPAPGGVTQTTTYKYTEHGEPESMTNPMGHTWKYEYADPAGDRTSETDPEGNKRTSSYNEDSQETSTVSPRGHASGAEEAKFKTTTERDAQGRPIKVTNPLAQVTKYFYDGDGNLETATDPMGHKTTYTYNADNEQTKVDAPNGAVTETGYDGAGQMTSQTDGNKHITKYERNILEQATEVIDPLGRKTFKEYDKAGNLTSVTDAEKRVTSYEYDPDGRLSEITYSDGKTPDVKYEYNGDGDRTKMVDGTGTVTYEYEKLDRLTETKDGHGNVVQYEYNLANEPTKITYPNGKAVTRAYDNDGRFSGTTDWLEHTTKFGYDPDSDLATTTFPTSTSDTDSYAYNDADEMNEDVMKRGTEILGSLVYTRNEDGLATKATTKDLPGESKPAFTYDENSRLTEGAGTPYKYDAANNVTTINKDTYAYNSADELENEKLKTATVSTYTYNEVGERAKTAPASGPATTYGYDQTGNLTSVNRPKEGEVTAIEDAYAYNGEGLRTSQTISGTTVYFAWDVAEGLPLILNDGTYSYIYGPGDLAVEQISGENHVQYLHHDQQGSTRLLTGETGKTEGAYTYTPYGGIEEHTGTGITPLRYDGQYTNSETGLIYLRAREYDPATGQFMNVDPEFEATREVYSYAGSDPLASGDPTGRSILSVGLEAGHYVVSAGAIVACAAQPEICAAAAVADVLLNSADTATQTLLHEKSLADALKEEVYTLVGGSVSFGSAKFWGELTAWAKANKLLGTSAAEIARNSRLLSSGAAQWTVVQATISRLLQEKEGKCTPTN
jgi:RHS repeat-associated protein